MNLTACFDRSVEELIADLELSPLNIAISRDLIHFKATAADRGEIEL